MAGHSSLFLCHIDEETELARWLKDALAAEFVEVDVFCVSDANGDRAFADNIDNFGKQLLQASAGIFVLSPTSLRRPWISFDLGALRMRNLLADHRGEAVMPLVAICHSGLRAKDLPIPIGQLHAVAGSDSAELHAGFHALQKAAGGRGPLRTDFAQLARCVRQFEIDYARVSAFRDFWMSLFDDPLSDLVRRLDDNLEKIAEFTVDIPEVEQERVDHAAEILRKHNLSDSIEIRVMRPVEDYTRRGVVNRADIRVSFDAQFYRSVRGGLDRLA